MIIPVAKVVLLFSVILILELKLKEPRLKSQTVELVALFFSNFTN